MSKKENKSAEKNNEPVNIETTTIEEAKAAPESDIKSAIVKCTALVLGAALLIYATSSCMGKISEANQKITESISAPASSDASAGGIDDSFFSDTASDSGEPADMGDTGADVSSDTSADASFSSDSGSSSSDTAGGSSSSSSSAAKSSTSDKKDTAAKKPTTKEEVVNYFNNAINKVKPNAKSVTQTKENNYQAGSIDLGSLGAFESVVNKLITSNMGENKEKSGLTATSAADKNKIFPVENETWASKLTAADVKEAKCTESNGVYTIGIKILDDDLSATTNHGASHNGKAISIVQTQSIYDNAGAASSLLKGLKIGYKNGTILAKVDAKTGNVLSVTYDFTWILHVDVFGGINAPFGITQVFEIKW